MQKLIILGKKKQEIQCTRQQPKETDFMCVYFFQKQIEDDLMTICWSIITEHRV